MFFLRRLRVRVTLSLKGLYLVMIVLAKYFYNYHLKCSRRCLQSEHHHHSYEYASFCHECRLLLIIILVHPDLVVSTKPVKETIHLVFSYDIKYPVRKW